MVKRSGAGALSERVHFQKRDVLDDGYGNPIAGEFTTQFTEPARLQPKLGSEPVLAARLTGVQPFLLVVRSSACTRMVTPAWRAMNARTGAVYNIATAANPDERNAWLEMLVTEGVAT
jgi:head-tail adaptor